MKLTTDELAFLSAWAREEWEPACYRLPAHRLQLSQHATAAELVRLIKAWTISEGKRDMEILDVPENVQPVWPWRTPEAFKARVAEAMAESIPC